MLKTITTSYCSSNSSKCISQTRNLSTNMCMFCGTLVSTSGCLHDHTLLFMIAVHAELIARNFGLNSDSQLFYVYSAMLLSVAYAGGKPFPGCIVPLLLREVEWFITSSQSCSHIQSTLDYPNLVYLELQ